MKYYKINNEVLFRNYGEFGYLTDNRNFGYTFSDKDFILGDEIVSETGADILSCLEKKVLSIDEITNRVTQLFDVDHNIQNEIIDFLDLLCSKGFIISGNSSSECEKNKVNFNEPYKECNIDKACTDTIDTQLFLSNYFKEEPFPTSIHVEIVSKCNERCIHCYIPHEFKTEMMDEKLFYNILDQSREMNLLHITISGGEPMMHPLFIDFIRKCREYDMSVNVLSNLTLLDDKIIAEMKRNPLLSVQTSIYSLLPKIHDGITCNKGSLEITMNSVLKLIDNHIPVQLSCPIMKANYSCYKDVKEWAIAHNISVGTDYSIIAKYNHQIDNLKCRLSETELKEVITEEMNDITSFYEIEKEIHDNKKKTSDNYICSVCNSSICINPMGNVYPCVGWSNKVVGNLKNNTLKNIWLDSEEVKCLRSIKRKEFTECEICEQKDFCNICMVRNSNESPTCNLFEVSKYFCNIARIKKQIYEKHKHIACQVTVKK